MSWFATLKSTRFVRARLICFHYAGGSVAAFREWGTALPDDVELLAVRLPGHAGRYGEPFMTNGDQIVSHILGAMRAYSDRPYYLFGHSMGARLAYELASKMQETGHRQASHLFVAARRAPQLTRSDAPSSGLPLQELIAKVRDYDGTAESVLSNDQLLDVLVPIWRADFAVSETFAYRERPRLSCPVTAIGGRDDKWVTEAELDAWRAVTDAEFSHHTIPGAHFFLNEERSRATVLEHVNTVLRKHSIMFGGQSWTSPSPLLQ